VVVNEDRGSESRLRLQKTSRYVIDHPTQARMSAEAKTKHRCLMVQFQCDSCTRYSRWTKLRCKVKPGEWTEHAGRHLCPSCHA
jgi:hypothetical protein